MLMDKNDVKQIRGAITFLREQAAIYGAVHDIAPFSSLGEFHAQIALKQEANRLEEVLRVRAK